MDKPNSVGSFVLASLHQTNIDSAPETGLSTRGSIPLVVENLKWQGNHNEVSFSYDLRNRASSNMVAYGIVWELHIGDQVVEVPQAFDGWLAPTERHLSPGDSRTFEFHAGAKSRVGNSPDRVVINLVYGEFEDGTRAGEKADEFSAHFQRSRQDAVAYYKGLAQAYASKGSAAAIAFLFSSHPDVASSQAQGRLQLIYGQSDIEHVMAEVNAKLATLR